MTSVTGDWNPKQKLLNEYLSDSSTFARGVALCMELHAQVHDPAIGEGSSSLYGELLQDLPKAAVTFRPEKRFASIAWNIWHITRIEDAVANILVADGRPLLDDAWLRRMKIGVRDTGNAFTAQDVDDFGAKIDGVELFAYRKAVGERTREILSALSEADRKRLPTGKQLGRIMEEGVLTLEEGSVWLLDFWSKKTVAGLLRMPITRHQIVHINDCFKLKAKYVG